MGQQQVHLVVQTIQVPRIEEKSKVKRPEERSLVKNKHRNQNCGQKKIVLGGPKENEARMAFRRQCGFRTSPSEKGFKE